MKVFLGADHRGFSLKEQLKIFLLSNNYQVEDLGAETLNKEDDFVDYALKVANKVSESNENRGILICGSGSGVEIAANKVNGIRCTLGQSLEQVKAARNDDDINILAIAGEFTDLEITKEMVKVFLSEIYEPLDRHERRIEKIKAIEESQ
jgi:ribose 5-phosphate isomerase B